MQNRSLFPDLPEPGAEGADDAPPRPDPTETRPVSKPESDPPARVHGGPADTVELAAPAEPAGAAPDTPQPAGTAGDDAPADTTIAPPPTPAPSPWLTRLAVLFALGLIAWALFFAGREPATPPVPAVPGAAPPTTDETATGEAAPPPDAAAAPGEGVLTAAEPSEGAGDAAAPTDQAEVAEPPPAAAGAAARALIARLEAKGQDEATGPAALYAQAEKWRAAGRGIDAWLLHFYLARHGHGPSALMLGRLADPALQDDYPSPLGRPDPVQAWKWYRAAARAGQAEAGERLAALRQRLEAAAGRGDTDARRLLLLWR